MSTDRPEPNSPACLAHEADDAYMGYATKDEIAAFLNELLEAERARHRGGAEERRCRRRYAVRRPAARRSSRRGALVRHAA